MKNIFQISKFDWQSLIDAVNTHAGEYIIVTRSTAGLEISIDENQLRRYIRVYLTKGWSF